MARLHLRYKNLHPRTIEAARELIEARPWSIHTEEDLHDVANTAARKIAQTYRAPEPFVSVIEDTRHMAENFDSESGTIYVSVRWNTTAFLAAVRSHILWEQGMTFQPEDAWTWACSLFYAADPIMFRSAARNGKIALVSARDTFTEESWARLALVGLANVETGELLTEPRNATLFLTTGEIAVDVEAEADEDVEIEADEPMFEVVGSGVVDVSDDDEPEAPVANGRFTMQADGLEALNISALRRLSRGHVSGGYNMRRDALIAALRQAGVRAEGE